MMRIWGWRDIPPAPWSMTGRHSNRPAAKGVSDEKAWIYFRGFGRGADLQRRTGGSVIARARGSNARALVRAVVGLLGGSAVDGERPEAGGIQFLGRRGCDR